ncbi:hypothetical protein [Asaia spathodeae]|uniref:Uncharacterized protein n=1 Tax=Asaia spathodeae TaxID=657016 RepID=A0ABX2P9J0_9PROT|nr:hypothetical protein [Asaia spathodeae]GBR16909.1 hypothetical protein AA105894_1689 [Asaia spathodeae NBRC 105894]
MSDFLTLGEKQKAREVIERAMRAGYAIRVWEGEDWALSKPSLNVAEIMAALGSTGEDRIDFVEPTPYTGQSYKKVGWILFIYGNCPDGSELYADWSDNELTNKIVS